MTQYPIVWRGTLAERVIFTPPDEVFDPMSPAEIKRRARLAVGDLLWTAVTLADLPPSPAMIRFFRDHLAEQEQYERAVQRHLGAVRPQAVHG